MPQMIDYACFHCFDVSPYAMIRFASARRRVAARSSAHDAEARLLIDARDDADDTHAWRGAT